MNNYKLLKKIDSPKDLRKIKKEDLNLLSKEISHYIHDTITKIGGHYSSPLGVVDLTIALHYAYNTPIDKLIWDVGHQAYAHKILTGRKNEFRSIRQKNSISGFLKIDESKYDTFGAGHASTSISAALGFAHARDKLKENHQVVAVIGDGSLTGGMAYEGLNNLGYHRTQLTVILNDNSYSISKSVGALSKYLTRITTNPTYNKLRKEIWNISNKLPVLSDKVTTFLKKTEGTVKSYLTPGILFEELGLRYIGPIDGHDLDNMIKVLNSVKEMNTPVLLHVFTNKSKSFSDKKHDAIKSYSISPSQKYKTNKLQYSKVFGDILCKLAPKYNFHCITAAMEIGTGMKKFIKDYSDRYIDVGIAEEHAITYAAGLSRAGILPIVPIYSTFMQRGYDQIIHDIALQEIPSIFCMDRAGIVGNDGPTHHGVFDIAFMRSIPNLIVTAPKDGNELYNLLYTAMNSNNIFSIRYPKEMTSYDIEHNPEKIELGKWETLKNGAGICILTFGSMIDPCMKASNLILEKYNLKVSVVNCRFIKPIDIKLLNELINNHNDFIIVEEGVISGGFGSSILEYFSSNTIKNNVKLLGIEDTFIGHGSRSELLEDIGLSYSNIYNIIEKIINEK